jgi:predicted ATP-grasp superfamily ATP-dependent carboligase
MAGIEVVVATPNPSDVALKSRHAKHVWLLPSEDGGRSESSLVSLLALGSHLREISGKRAPLYYGSDQRLAFIYRHRDELAREYALCLNDAPLAEALLYKDSFARLALERGVRTPRTFLPGSDQDDAIAKIEVPVIAKPRDKVRYADIRRQMLGPSGKAATFENGRALVEHPGYAACRDNLVVQELVPGDEERLFSFHGFADEGGQILAWFCGRKVRAFPSPAGESSCIELVTDEAAALYGKRVASALGLKGVFKIDIIQDARTGVYYTLEVNARYNLWHYLGAADGINLPEVAYDYLVFGRTPPGRTVRPRHRWINVYRDYKSYKQLRSRGSLGLWAWLRSLARKPAVFETFAWDDPAPTLYWIRDEIGKRRARWRSTA